MPDTDDDAGTPPEARDYDGERLTLAVEWMAARGRRRQDAIRDDMAKLREKHNHIRP